MGSATFPSDFDIFFCPAVQWACVSSVLGIGSFIACNIAGRYTAWNLGTHTVRSAEAPALHTHVRTYRTISFQTTCTSGGHAVLSADGYPTPLRYTSSASNQTYTI